MARNFCRGLKYAEVREIIKLLNRVKVFIHG